MLSLALLDKVIHIDKETMRVRVQVHPVPIPYTQSPKRPLCFEGKTSLCDSMCNFAFHSLGSGPAIRVQLYPHNSEPLISPAVGPSPLKLLIWLQAGCRIAELATALRGAGLTLPNYASIREQAVGGFIQVYALYPIPFILPDVSVAHGPSDPTLERHRQRLQELLDVDEDAD